eukprot:TRINITY_DN4557_c0_g1_i1.p1 TRINITY_DN4557_c0_g1~~TRINITY_DN4557_c0_g1_i1.p1  ORF type:complete len:298 (-),score=54.69 TRINITY_DN4557_c0_g1_i1:37-930(-)
MEADDGVSWKKKHKRVIVYGAGSGYGASLAKAYASKGHCMLTLVGRNIQKLQKVEKECRDLGAFEVVVSTCDFLDLNQFKTITEDAVHTFGGVELIVFAIVSPPKQEKFENIENVSAALQDCMRINYHCCTWAFYAGLPYLKRYKGHFVVVTSIEAELATQNMSFLAAATHATHSFMDSVIKESPGFDITVVCSPPVYSAAPPPPNENSKLSAIPLAQATNYVLEAIEKKKRKAFLGAVGVFSDSPSLLLQTSTVGPDSLTKVHNLLYKAPPCREMKTRGSCPRGNNCPFSHDMNDS